MPVATLMLSVTPLYAGLLTVLLMVLSFRVVKARRAARVSLGVGGDPALERAVRAHGNFVEYVPLGLLLILLAELNGAGPWLLHLLGLMLLVGRLLHAWGLGRTGGVSFGRYWGTLLTWLMILLSGLLNLVLLVL